MIVMWIIIMLLGDKQTQKVHTMTTVRQDTPITPNQIKFSRKQEKMC